jgi:phage-related protein
MTRMSWEIEYFETGKGRCPVQEFIDSLDTRSKAKIARTLDLLEEFGIKLGMPYAKHVEGDLWELRTRAGSNQYRIIYVSVHRRGIHSPPRIHEEVRADSSTGLESGQRQAGRVPD